MVNLGDKVEDMVSGFTGIAVARHIYLNGCNRISVQPPIDKDGKLPEIGSFDEPQLRVTKEKAAENGSANTGGPEKYMPNSRPE